MSVCLSVRHRPVLCRNCYIWHQTFSTIRKPHHSSFLHQTLWRYSEGTPLTGASNEVGYEKFAIFDQYVALSRKRYKIGHSYYGTPMGTRTRSVEWYHFQWPWKTADPDFQVTPLSDAECIRNGTRYRHSYNPKLIRSYTCPTQRCCFEWPWVTQRNIQWREASRGLSATVELLVA